MEPEKLHCQLSSVRSGWAGMRGQSDGISRAQFHTISPGDRFVQPAPASSIL